MMCSALSVSARDSSGKSDSALMKKVARLEERVDRHQREITSLKTENSRLSKKASAGKVSNRPAKAVVTRRGSKQVSFE